MHSPGMAWLRAVWLSSLLGLAFGVSSARSDPEVAVAAIPTDKEPITPIPEPPRADSRKLALGARLFSDPGLSGDGSRSCSSCHDLRTNGATGRRLDPGLAGSEPRFNTLTVFNAALNFRFGWEGKFRTLEQQTAASLESPTSMGSSLSAAVQVVQRNADLRHKFEEAYGHGPDRDSLLDSLVIFERSLLTPNSRFDRWLKGDAEALTPEERGGYQLFKTLGCISCHQGVNVGGNLFQRHGIFHPLASPNPKILRVPSLRNVATTAPYFHDGSAPTLEDAVRKMAYAQLDQHLTKEQIATIIAFLKTLTGQYNGKPVTAPAE
jgi:cytochrome c peroxidase